MKNLSRKILALALAAVMMAGATYAVSASEGLLSAGPEIMDMYSPWAEWDVIMASNIYGLGNEGTYSNYRGNFSELKFIPVFDSLAAQFGAGGSPAINNKNLVTRGEVVSSLYIIIVDALGLDGALPAIDYFVKNGLILGRAAGDYQLDNACTTEEMIIFSVRVYEHISYALGLDSACLFWKITGGGLPNTVYLLGTVHMGERSIYPLSKSIMQAFNQAAYLAVEANIYTMSAEDIAYIGAMQMLTDGSTIKDHISAGTYAIYQAACEFYGIPAEMYDYIKPWAAMMLFNQLLSAGTGEDAASALLGMDVFLLMKAVSAGKDIIEVESIRYQLELFDSFSPALQEMLLLSVIAPPADAGGNELSMEEFAELMSEYLAYLIYAIKTGDEDILTEMLMASRDYSDPLLYEYNTKLWDIRDAGMADTVEGYLNDATLDGDVFVAVGAGHTIGGTGIVHVLTERGYTAERLR